MALGQPGGNGSVEFVQMARKEVVRFFHDNQTVFSGERRDHSLDFFSRAELVVGAVNEEFRFGATRKKRKVAAVHRDAESDQFADSRIPATNPQAHDTAEAETCEQERNTRKLRSEIVHRGLYIALLATSFIVFARAQTRATKIEAKNRDAQGVQGFRDVIDDLVMHRPAKERVGMANHSCQQGGIRSRRCPEYGLEAAGGAFKEQVL